MTKHYLAVDLGATSGRVILASVTDGTISQETLHRFPTPLVQEGEKYYWDIHNLFDNIVEGLGVAGKRGLAIESIGIDTWGVDFAPVAADGSVGMPRSYRDPYTTGVPEKFFGTMPRAELYDRTGIQIMNFNSVFQIYAQNLEGDVIRNAETLLFMPDALSYMLTGNKVCEYTILSTSALMDPRTKTLDAKILSVCGAREDQFAPIVYPGHVVGTLKDEIADKTGLGAVKVVAVAGHDTGSAVATVPAKDSHFAYLSSGTWSLMGIETKEPVINEKMASLNYTNEGGVGGTTRLLKNITGMWLVEQCIKAWKAEGKTIPGWGEIAERTMALPASEHLIDPDEPAFASPTDMPRAIAANLAERGFEAPADEMAMIRLIYDSLAAKYAQTLEKLKEIASFPIDTLHIIGGGSQNSCVCQLTANACGITVVAGPGEGTALGNVMIQAGISRPELLKSVETKTYKPIK